LGHGESAKPQGVSYDSSLWDWQVETLVKDVIGQKVLLVGHSLGGYIAMRLAARAPRDVAGLCLIAPAGRYGVLHPLSFNFPGLGLGPVATVLGQETFKKLRTPEAMRKTLQFLYKDGAEVSQKLVQDLASPWLDPKSQQVSWMWVPTGPAIRECHKLHDT
jgi:pimeloyl-ACP methyl ester carboxylesterase